MSRTVRYTIVAVLLVACISIFLVRYTPAEMIADEIGREFRALYIDDPEGFSGSFSAYSKWKSYEEAMDKVEEIKKQSMLMGVGWVIVSVVLFLTDPDRKKKRDTPKA